MTEAVCRSVLDITFGEAQQREILKHYEFGVNLEENRSMLLSILARYSFENPAKRAASLVTQAGGKAYVYRIDFSPDFIKDPCNIVCCILSLFSGYRRGGTLGAHC